jgi:hypothetical protein
VLSQISQLKNEDNWWQLSQWRGKWGNIGTAQCSMGDFTLTLK